ncbi:hypothetical protein DXT98_01135 [Agrobacterium sp. ICMP 7243]|nr:hypothetical protein DXT98_01135 [Agrobacterium sp. ICMP 7243]
MAHDVSLFNFKGHELRTMVIDGEPWFIAGDLCAALGLPTGKGSGRWLRGYGVIEKKPVNRQAHPELFIRSKAQTATIISRESLYKIAMYSDRPEAKHLWNWVARVVLPAILGDDLPTVGDGHLVSGEPSEDEVIFKAIEVMKRRMERLAAEQAKAKAIIDGLLSCTTVSEYR